MKVSQVRAAAIAKMLSCSFSVGLALFAAASVSAQPAGRPEGKGKGNTGGGPEGGVESQSLGEGDLGGGFGSQTSSSIDAPPDHWTVSGGNVDLRSGTYIYSNTDLAVGSESASFSFDRTNATGVKNRKEPFGNFSHNWDAFAAFDIHYSGPASNPDPENRVSIWVGGKPETFEHHYSATAGKTVYTNLSFASGAIIDTNGAYPIFRPDGGTDVHFANGLNFATKIVNPNGAIVDLAYDTGPDSAKRLRRVTSNRGFAVLLEYGVQNGQNVISKACIYNTASVVAPASNVCNSSAHQTTTYTYTYFSGRVRLASATDSSGQTWQFNYAMSGSDVLMKFRRPGESTDWLVNTISDENEPEFLENGAVTRQDFADGSYFTYNYILASQLLFYQEESLEPSPVAGGLYFDGAGASRGAFYGVYEVPNQWVGQSGGQAAPVTIQNLKYQVTPGPQNVTAPNGGSITNDYCDRFPASQGDQQCYFANLQTQTDPEGNRREYYWFYRPSRVTKVEHHPKPGSGDPVLVEEAEYGCTARPCKSSPTRYTDMRGNVTDFTYDPVHGGVLTKTLPADANGVRPQARYSYVQKYAWVKNGSSFSQASSPVWVLASEEYCRTSAAVGSNCAAGAGDEVVATYEYEQGSASKGSNILLLGMAVTADGQTLRTCYGYDSQGRKISETQPKANLASCS